MVVGIFYLATRHARGTTLWSTVWFTALFPLGAFSSFIHWCLETSTEFDSYSSFFRTVFFLFYLSFCLSVSSLQFSSSSSSFQLFPRITFFVALTGIALTLFFSVGQVASKTRIHGPHPVRTLLMHLFSAIWLVMEALVGQKRYPPLVALLLQLGFFAWMQHPPFAEDKDSGQSTAVLITLWSLCADGYFFATGHQATFSSIDWAPGFVGLDEMSLILSGAMVRVILWRMHRRDQNQMR